MKNIFKTFGIIALVAVIGFSMTACGDSGTDGGTTPVSTLAAPTGLTATLSSTTLAISWNAVVGAAGYNLYIGSSSTTFEPPEDMGGLTSVPMSLSELPSGTYTLYFKVAAYSANRTEGAMSIVINKTITNGSTPTTYSLDGVWENENGNGMQVTVSGSTGVLKVLPSSNALWTDAINKNYVKVGDTFWRNLTSTGNLTWSGQSLGVYSNTSSPNVATGTGWANTTFTLSADGQTLTITGADTWTRKTAYSLDGVWENENGNGMQVTVSGSTGVLKVLPSSNALWTDAINKNYVKVGDTFWRNLTSTGNLTWSGQSLGVYSNTSSPNVATGTGWANTTFTLSADGQTLTITGADTWTRKQ